MLMVGCTPGEPAGTGSPPTTATPSASATPTRVLKGTFASQAVETSGEAVITRSAGSLVLELKDFSTTGGDDAYVTVNPGAMTRIASGDNVVNDPTRYLLEKLKAASGTQSYDLSYMIQSFPEVQSITIYNNTTREAYGSANLHAK